MDDEANHLLTIAAVLDSAGVLYDHANEAHAFKLYLDKLMNNPGQGVSFFPFLEGVKLLRHNCFHGLAQKLALKTGRQVVLSYIVDTKVFRLGPVYNDWEDEGVRKSICLLLMEPPTLADPYQYGITGSPDDFVAEDFIAGVVAAIKEAHVKAAADRAAEIAAAQAFVDANVTGLAAGKLLVQLAPRPVNPHEKIPKPRNCFIIFRQEQMPNLRSQLGKRHAGVYSKILAEQWRKLNEVQKGYYKYKAGLEKLAHQEKYPGWKCSPRRSSEINRRQSRAGGASGSG